MVVFFRFVQGGSTTLDPGVSLKLFILFSNANTQVGADSLTLEQPPERQRLCQTGRMYQSVPIRGVHHVRGKRRALARFGAILFWLCVRKESLQRRLRRMEPSPSQAQGNNGQQHYRAQKETLRRPFQNAKSSEPFPHQQGALGASRYPSAGSAGQQS